MPRQVAEAEEEAEADAHQRCAAAEADSDQAGATDLAEQAATDLVGAEDVAVIERRQLARRQVHPVVSKRHRHDKGNKRQGDRGDDPAGVEPDRPAADDCRGHARPCPPAPRSMVSATTLATTLRIAIKSTTPWVTLRSR